MTDLCRIPKGSRIVYGSGGSTAMIVLTPDNRALKYFPLLSRDIAIPAKEQGRYFSHITNEIKILGTLTRQFLAKKRTPHIVGLIGAHYCPEIPRELFADCISFVKVISTKANNKPPCTFLHPNTIVNNGLHIAEVEYCNSSLGAELRETVLQYCNTGDFSILETFLDRLLFQVAFTLKTIYKQYPFFIHYDMFCRNILAIRSDASRDNYFRYNIDNRQYDLPASGLFIKINDFGLSQLAKSNRNVQNHYLDLFNIIYDVYNGQNMGCDSIRYIIKDYGIPIGKFPSKAKLDVLHKKQDELLGPVHKYFNRFINVPAIKKAQELNKKWMIDSEWGAVKNDEVRRFLLRTSVDDILAYSARRFKPTTSHIIADVYGEAI